MEQQLKLHIEVLSDKIEELEKERTTLKAQHEKEQQAKEEALRDEYRSKLDDKDVKIEELRLEIASLQARVQS